MAADEQWSAFFDTTELWRERLLKERLAETAKKTGAGLYVCELVVEERAFQRVRDFHEEYTRIRSAKAKIEGYVRVEIGEHKGDGEMLDDFRKAERAALAKDGFLIIPTEGITTAEHATLLTYRDPRIKEKKRRGVPGGLNDAVILLSSMKYATARGLKKCLFVSKNTDDFSDRLVEGLGRKYGQEWRFVKDVEVAIRSLERPDLTKAATEFMRANPQSLLRFIERENANIWPDSFLLFGPPALEDIEAFTIEPLTDGGDVKLCFQATVIVAQRVPSEPSPIRAATFYLGGFQGSAFGLSVPQNVRLIEGEAQARLERGQFVGEPQILTVRPRGLEIRAAN